MKSFALSLITLFIFTGCDAPQRNRPLINSNSLEQPASPYGSPNNNNPWGTPTTGNGTTTGTTTGSSTSGQNPQRPPGYETCDITANHYSAGLGYMGICQSTLDETSVAVLSTLSDTVRTCLIPTYKDGSGSSTYLGQPQCFIPEANKVSMGTMYKNRNGFTDRPINGVMIMKETSLTAYFTCMDAYLNFRDSRCPMGARTNPFCDQLARSFMITKCDSFKMSHSYLDLRLK
jgi:hypothetical protein